MQLILHQSSICLSHLISSSLDRDDIEFSVIVIIGIFFAILYLFLKVRLLITQSELAFMASAALNPIPGSLESDDGRYDDKPKNKEFHIQ